MPRTKLDAIADPGAQMRGTVRKYQYISGKTIEGLALDAGCSKTKVYARLHDPYRLSIRDLQAIKRSFGIPNEELMRVLEAML
jgi:hypothetical protein